MDAEQKRRHGLYPLILIVLIFVVIGMILLMLAIGSVNIPVADVVSVLLGRKPSLPAYTVIIFQFRLPRALTAALAGAALSIGGLQMQTLFRNPLTDAFVLGISSGASLGVALVVLTTGTTGLTLLAGLGLLGDFGLAAAASIGAGLTLLLVLAFAGRVQSSITLLVLGLMFGYAISAIVSLLLYFSVPERIQAYIGWTFGSFGGLTWQQMPIFAPLIILALLISYTLAKPLNALLLGEIYAQSMGVNIRQARLRIMISTALLAGTVTAFCGPVAFLGIAIPHISRMLFRTSDHYILLPAVTLLGAIGAMLADLVAQVPGREIVLPLNAITALVGAPIVIWIILSQRNLRSTFSG